ncbi:MAG TPA: hypothetical protein VHD33_02190, partial [Legionellaceae bacterium]|nr:hypothetical protein [Legionellaceae bacterium]
ERKIVQLGDAFPIKTLPFGLFREVHSGMDCICEIVTDLQTLRNWHTKSESMVRYLAERLSRKIHILVHICIENPAKKSDNSAFALETISTRAQWLQDLAHKRVQLEQQRNALQKTLQQMRLRQSKEAVFKVEQELEDIERQLELLKSV